MIGFGYWHLTGVQHFRQQLLHECYMIFFRTYDAFILNINPLEPGAAKVVCSLLTHRRHLGNSGCVRAIQESGLVVVDVLNLDDELRLGLHGLVGEPVQCLGSQCVVRLLLTIQPLGGMNVPSVLINNENGTCPFA